MATVEIKNMKVLVDNCGMITIINNSGNFCFVYMHPVDTVALVRFLVKNGMNFSE